ncbi:MAG: hypothetical protein HY238_25385 [Acidobacteria bacterium]|nr:hypothetical protein [Acidobacteriota bacterium]
MRGILPPLLLAAALLWAAPLPAAERWEMQYFYDKNDSALAFLDVQFPSAQHGAALGMITERRRRKPVLALTSDGGRTWEVLPLKEPAFSLFFLDEKAGWIVGEKGKLWKTADGGRTWTAVEKPGGRAQPLRVFFLDASRGWLLCTQKEVYRTQDGGRTWQLLPISRKPDRPETETAYTWAAVFHDIFLISGFSRAPSDRPRLPEWMQPELIPLGRNPTTSVILHSHDGGKNWSHSELSNVGEIVCLRIASTGRAFLLLHHPDSFSLPSEIIALDLQTLRGNAVYGQAKHFLTDLAFAGPGRILAAAIDQDGKTPFPAIPSRLKILQSADGRQWTEMEVDYRAEARSARLAATDESHAWVATDTGMILHLVRE